MSTKRWTLLPVCLGTFMLLLDITVVNVALPADAARGLGEAVASGGAQQAIESVPPSARGVVEEAATRAFLDGFNHIIVVAAVIAFAGAVLSLLLIRDRDLTAPGPPA